MANTIKIKAGSGTPTTSNIVDRELAFDRSANKLYINDNGSIVDLSGEVGDITAVTAGTGLDGGGSSGDVTLSVDVSDFMSNGSNNRILTATGTDAMNAEANLTFGGSHLKLLVDSGKFIAGAGEDFSFYHSGTHSWIDNLTGNLYIRNQTDDGQIIMQTDDGSGATTTYMSLKGNEQLIRFLKSTRHNDNVLAQFGSSNDFKLKHDGSNSYIINNTGHLYIQNTGE